MALSLEELQNSTNIAELLDDEQLHAIGSQVTKGYDLDLDSLSEWREKLHEAMDIAKQVMDEKSFPWPDASNIKYPLITQAAVNYAARTLPSVIQKDKVVKALLNGADPNGESWLRSTRVTKFMSWQLLFDDRNWLADIDQFLHIWPVVGTLFKKTYHNPISNKNCSDLITPDKVIVNYAVKDLESARRITHKMVKYVNDIIENQRRGVYLDTVDIALLTPQIEDNDLLDTNMYSVNNLQDEDHALEILEQHCWLDLDEDGYREPYIVTVHRNSEQVLRIIARFDKVEKNKKDEVIRISAKNFFTVYKFMPSFDGGFYGVGFGFLLLPINKAVNSLMNQLIDSGTLSVTQGGFIGGGIRIKDGDFNIKMGEWKMISTMTGTSLSQNIVPLPVREPSQVILSLLTMLINIGKDLSSTTDALTGKEQAQNVSQNVLASLIEQGTKVFDAINQRFYRSLSDEFQKLYDLNREFISDKEYRNVLNDPEAKVKEDFNNDNLNVYPVGDPSLSTEQQRIQRAGIIQQLRTVDPRAADMLLLQTMQLEDNIIQMLLPPPDPNAPPPPEVIKLQSESDLNKAKAAEIMAKLQLSQQEIQMELEKLRQEIRESNSRVTESQARTWKMQEDVQSKRRQLDIAAGKMVTQAQHKEVDMVMKQTKSQADTEIKIASLQNKAAKDAADTQIDAMKIAADLKKSEDQIEIQKKNKKKPVDDKP